MNFQEMTPTPADCQVSALWNAVMLKHTLSQTNRRCPSMAHGDALNQVLISRDRIFG
jgi:hypothetical protein